MSTLTVYTTPDCHLCRDALVVLRELRGEFGFALVEVDITREDDLHRAYLERIPVGVLDGEEIFEYFVDADLLRDRLRAGLAGPPR